MYILSALDSNLFTEHVPAHPIYYRTHLVHTLSYIPMTKIVHWPTTTVLCTKAAMYDIAEHVRRDGTGRIRNLNEAFQTRNAYTAIQTAESSGLVSLSDHRQTKSSSNNERNGKRQQ